MVSELEYLERERAASGKHEYWAGRVMRVPEVSYEHGLLLVRVLAMCVTQTRDTDLVALPSRMRVHASEARAFLYPDVVLVEHPPDFFDDSQDTITNPRAVIEIVSRTSLEHDRGPKLRAYQRIPSVNHCVLVREDAVNVEHHWRQGDAWEARELGRGETLCISAGLQLEVNAIYRQRPES